MLLSHRVKETVLKIGPLGFIAFGGPAVHVVLFRSIFVNGPKPWLDAMTFSDLFSLSGALPGPGSTQLLFSIGLVRGGISIGFLAFFLFSLPGAITMCLLSLGASKLPASLPPVVLALLTGLNAAAVGLIFFSALQLTRATAQTEVTKLILFSTAAIGSCFSAIWLFPVLTLGGGVATLVIEWSGWKVWRQKLRREPQMEVRQDEVDGVALEELGTTLTSQVGVTSEDVGPRLGISRSSQEGEEIQKNETGPLWTRLPTPPPDSTTLRRRPQTISTLPPPESAELVPPQTTINLHLTILHSLFVITLFLTLLVTFLILQSTLPNRSQAIKLFTSLLTAGSILFGGGPVVIPLLQGYTVAPGWVSTQEFLLGYAILSAMPGPNFNFAVYLGALSLPHSPVIGAVLAYIGIYTPGLLLKLALLPVYNKFREQAQVRTTLRGLNAAASGLVWGAAYRLWKVGLLTSASPHSPATSASLEKSGYWISISGAALLASETFAVPPYLVIFGGAVLGLCYGGVIGSP